MPQHRHQSAPDRLPIRNRNDFSHRRNRRHSPPLRRRPLAVALALATLLLLLALPSLRRLKGSQPDSGSPDADFELRNGSNFSGEFPKEVEFGHGSRIGNDSRFWDRDDRRRDIEDLSEKGRVSENGIGQLGVKSRISESGQLGGDLNEEKVDGVKGRVSESGSSENGQLGDSVNGRVSENGRGRGVSLYNEGGRAELDSYKVEYETLLTNSTEEYDDVDDGIDVKDDIDEDDHDADLEKLDELDGGGVEKDEPSGEEKKDPSSLRGSRSFSSTKNGNVDVENGKGLDLKTGSKKKSKRRKFSTCPINFLNSTAQIIEPPENKKFARFSLQYTDTEEIPSGSENWEPRFAGHQTLHEREESFYARDQKINCGFVKDPSGSPSTGFDIADDDKKFMRTCHVAVSSCIFGSSDHLRTPFSRTITSLSRKNVCFVMFIDEETLQTLLSDGQKMDAMGFMGLWKIVVLKNLPYKDMRRVGKVPKFLAHRLFPSARYSIWLDSKLRLQTDPYLILERFLWRHSHEYAISNHYDRHCVWEEVMQNKKLNKYNHTVIDQQFEFYQSDGLKKFDPSDPNKLLPSYVPEGSFIVREHTPMSNLFSCLWFNEVDRFTSRDQLSFAYTFMKLRRMNPDKPLYMNMFKDCERRAMAKLFHHRAEEKKTSASTQSAR